MKKLLVAAVAAGLSLGARQAAAQTKFQNPQCDVSMGYFLVNQSVVYLKGAAEEESAEKRAELLASARRNLFEAIDRGEVENPSVWYFLARTYAMSGDVVGADSAFDRAATMLPDCAEDIALQRQIMWVPMINEAVDSLRAGAFDAAKNLLTSANIINSTDNVGFYYLARLYGNEGELDSAVHYFLKVVEIGPADTARRQNYDDAIQNLAQVYGFLDQWDSAAVWYGKYREMYPDDATSLVGLAEAHSRAGDEARATIMYDSIVVMAAGMDAADLFRAGEALFVAGEFARATQAFGLGLEKNPYARDALYNLANTLLVIAGDPEYSEAQQNEAATDLEQTAHRILDIDPQNREARDMLIAALQLQGNDTAAEAEMERIDNMRFEVVVDFTQPMEGGFGVQGRVMNLQSQQFTIPEITFEFLNAQGTVVTTEVVGSKGLAANDMTGFSLTAVGDNIVAYRYKIGS